MKTTQRNQHSGNTKLASVLVALTLGLGTFNALANAPKATDGGEKIISRICRVSCPNDQQQLLAMAGTIHSPENLDATTDRFTEDTEHEKSLAIEDWMTDAANFGTSNLTEVIETEEPLCVESWMADAGYFSGTESDRRLTLENWMTEPKNWK